jgi:Fe-S-cluster containining protein
MFTLLPEFYCPFIEDCYHCCLETEMFLSNMDVSRIEKLGFSKENFLEGKEGFLALKNVDGKCFFLKEKMCSIYENRPQGCRFYPLIYDFEEERVVIDKLCIHHQDFNVAVFQPLFDKVLSFVLKLVEEKDYRLEQREKKNDTEKENKIESDMERIERVMEETIEEVSSEEIKILEESMDEEAEEVSKEIKKLEADMKEEMENIDEQISLLEETIEDEMKEIDRKYDELDNLFFKDKKK